MTATGGYVTNSRRNNCKQCEELERQTDKWLCDLFDCWGFVNRGKVTNIEREEAENENGKYDIQ